MIKSVAKDFRGGKSVAIGDFSRYHPTMPFDRTDYEDLQLDPIIARRDISELLELPSKKEIKRQRRQLIGKDLEDWIQFEKELADSINTEVELHHF